MSSRPRFRSSVNLPLLFGLLTALLYWAVPVETQDSLQIGYSILTPDPESPSPVAIALFRLANNEGTLISEAGVEAVRPIRSGRIFVDQADALTGLALANLGSDRSTVQFVLRRAGGSEEARLSLSFDPGQQRALFVNPDLFPDAASDFSGTLTFTALNERADLAAVTIRQAANARANEPIFATLPVVSLDGGSQPATSLNEQVIFPHIGAGQGLSTQIVLINRTSQASMGMIRLRRSDGQPLEAQLNGVEGSEFPFQLPPDGAFRGSVASSGGIVQGFAAVEAVDGPAPAGTAIFQFRDDRGGLISEAGVAAAEATRHLRLFVDAIGTQTGVAFANLEEVEVPIEVELRDRNGFLLQTAQSNVPAGGHAANFAEQFFGGLPGNFTGLMEVRSATPLVPISLKLTQNSRGDPILTTLPVADLTRPLFSEILAFPQIGFGSADQLRFSTQFILLSSSLENVSSGTLRFLNPDGGLFEVPLAGQNGSEFPVRLEAGSARRLRPGNTARPARIEIQTEGLTEVTVNVGNTVSLAAAVLDDRGEVRDDLDLSFASLDSQVAAVDRFGRLTGNEPGFSTLSVSSGGALANVTVAVVGIASGGSGFEITGIARDLSRRLYLADTVNHSVLRADNLEEIPDLYAGVSGMAGLRDDRRGAALFSGPAFLALNQASGALYVSDSLNHAVRIVEAGPNGQVGTLTGGVVAGHRDGPLETARFNEPEGLALDEEGNLWVADRGNHVIRRISLSTGVVETVAGRPGEPGFRDGRGDDARFNSPIGLAVEEEPLAERLDRLLRGEGPPAVRVIVADFGNGVLRRIDEEGRVESVTALDASAAPASAAVSSAPFDVTTDGAGNVYVTDREAGRVQILLRDGGLAEAAEPNTFPRPTGIVVADAGRVVIADENRFGTEARFGAPEISEVSPARVSSRGGEGLTVRGRNFAPETVVVVANRVLGRADVVIQDSQTLQAVLPPLSSGLTTLTVQNRGGLAQAALLVEPIPLSDLAPGVITTVVGGSTFSGDGGLALEAPTAPVGIALDPQGRVLFLDSSRNSLRRIDPDSGVVTSVAGNGVPGSEGDGGLATAASLFPVFPGSSNFVIGAAVDPSGNIYLTDDCRVRRIDVSTGFINSAAGGRFGFCGDDGPALEACFNNPNGLAFDYRGNLYVADSGNHRVRRIDAETGLITTVAGNGADEFSGDGGPALEAGLNSPVAIALDQSGNLFISTRRRIRRVDLQGNISTFAGNGEDSGVDVGDGGPAVEADIAPFGLAVDVEGAVIVADQGNHRIRRIDPSGVITTVAGTGESGFSGDGEPAVQAELSDPNDLALDGAGNIFFCDLSNYRVRRIEAGTGLISTVAGNGQPRFDDEGGPLASSALLFPRGLAFDEEGNLYISDSGNSRIRRAGIDGRIRTIAGKRLFEFSGDGGPATEADLSAPRGLAVDGAGNLLLADTENNRIRRIDAEGIIDTAAGASLPAFVPGFGGDGGPAEQALLARPRDIGVDGAGNLYIADTENDRVRRVDAVSGIIETLVGEGGIHPEPLLLPSATEVTAFGALLIADAVNRRILRLETGQLSLAAGGTAQIFCDQNDRATEVSLSFPQGLTVDGEGGFYVADTINHRVLRVDAGGTVTTVAGDCSAHFSGDGGAAAQASLNAPSALVLDSEGNLYIADTNNHRIRAVRAASFR